MKKAIITLLLVCIVFVAYAQSRIDQLRLGYNNATTRKVDLETQLEITNRSRNQIAGQVMERIEADKELAVKDKKIKELEAKIKELEPKEVENEPKSN